MTPKEGSIIAIETELVARLRHCPILIPMSNEQFSISRDDLKILMQTRTEAANLFEQMAWAV